MKKLFFTYLIISLFSAEIKADSFYQNTTPFNEKAVYTDSSSYDVNWYAPSIEFSIPFRGIKASCTIVATVTTRPLSTLWIELTESMIVDSIIIDNQKVTHTHLTNGWVIAKPTSPIETGKKFKATYYYQGEASGNSLFGGGVSHSFNSNGQDIISSQSEAFDAKLWFPCKQDVTDKADSVRMTVIAPHKFKVGSNGVLISEKNLSGKRKQFVWTSHYPIAYYLISFAASNYIDYTYTITLPSGKRMPIVNYIYSNSQHLKEEKQQLDSTAFSLILFSKLFGEYPFANEKYGHCQAPIGGGMEHQTMTTLIDFEFLLITHELAHQWFGDCVTCATWQDIWINEGFASYCEYIACENLLGTLRAREWLDDCFARARSARSGSVYIPDGTTLSDSRLFSDALSYKKGAAILHMLRYEINNDQLFFSILKNYFAKYKHKSASGKDFFSFVNEQTNSNYDWFMNQWYFGEGYPIFAINWHQQDNELVIDVKQKGSSSKAPIFKTTLEFKVLFKDGTDTLIRVANDKPNNIFSLRFEKEINVIRFNPNSNLLCSYSIQKSGKEKQTPSATKMTL
jgi:aminopeptidase N